MYKLKSGRHFEKTVSAHASHHNHGLANTNTDDKLVSKINLGQQNKIHKANCLL
jgi:hypothetical protein